ncbi:GMC family oxidoreductase [Tropicimonas sp. IMCC6043]|uniref:GMC family oxidoreductase n=1 Tax=Tropicimonas sp. IMCC6043 TaxID=2510645 RepID=UPI00101DED08|nr:GMC family oxidoreductase N-terminal domain-containing protein [Tropicimonas sp. IMCC6043]RYH07547.1 FAD-binding protein [Tropicimonas sp. IMCC6043]
MTGDSFDYVVVGAGSAGSVVAGRLAEAGNGTVCVIEAGGRDWHPAIHVPAAVVYALGNPRLDWMFRTAPGPGIAGRSILQSRGKVFGGSGAINGHICTRGHRTDFDGWAALGNPGWSYAEVLPYFKRSESRIGSGEDTYRGRSGPFTITDIDAPDPLCEAFMDAAAGNGISRAQDYNGAVQEGIAYVQRSIRNGRRVSPARAFVLPAVRRGAVDLRLNARVTRLHLDGKRVTGVTYLRDGREHTVHARREVILSAGAIGSPHILQLSGIGAPDGLKQAGIDVKHPLPGVGGNLQDHFAARIVLRIKGARTVNERVRGLPLLREVADYVFRRKGALTLTPTLLYCFAKSDPALPRGDIQVSFTPASYPGGVWSGLDRFPGATMACWQQRPESRGHVRALSSDPFASPEVQPNYLVAEADQRAIVAAMRLARSIAASAPFAQYVAKEDWPGAAAASDGDLLDHARQNGNTTYHVMGTCRMGPADDHASVVDHRLQVHGLTGLRVADTSIIPEMPAANTNVPALMIGERAADFSLGREPLPPADV